MLCLNDFEEHARKYLDKKAWTFYSMGAEKEQTLNENVSSYRRYHLVSRVLRNAALRDMSVSVLGELLPVPFGIAPTAYHKLAHPDGEAATAKAASEVGTVFTLSTVSNTPLEEVAETVRGASPLWMQVYMLKDRKITHEMVQRAEKVGYKALVLTVDTPVKGLQYKAWRNPLELSNHLLPCNIADAIKKVGIKYEKNFIDLFESNMTWNDVTWLMSISSLPVIVKGITNVQDAVKAASLGVAAVWISNHGGRNLDSLEATIDLLPTISSALSGTGCQVYVDGGVRWGSDVFKALALGANYVFIGRPALWGLAHSGKDGVRKILEILKFELDVTMQLTGCSDIKEVGAHYIKRKHFCRL